MDKGSIMELLREIGADKGAGEISGWVSAPCPLAPWRHERRVDRHPSFGIKIDDDGPSRFNCFTCHQHGSLTELLKEISEHTGTDFTGLITNVDKEELLGSDLPEWGQRKLRTNKPKLGEPVDEDILFAYESAKGNPYLKSRGISDSIVERFQLMYDPDNRGVPRVLVPIRHTDGSLYGFLGRATNDGIPKVRDYLGLPKRQLLFGAHEVVGQGYDRIVVVEGVFDALRIWQYGFPAVAVMHSTLTAEQTRTLTDIAQSVLLLYDNDKAGREGRSHAANKLKKYMPCFKAKYPTGVNDPDELTRIEFHEMLAHQRLI